MKPLLNPPPGKTHSGENYQRGEEETRQQREAILEEVRLPELPRCGFTKEEAERSLNGLDPKVRMGPGLPLYILIRYQYRGYRATRVQAGPQGQMLTISHALSPAPVLSTQVREPPQSGKQSFQRELVPAETPDSPSGSPCCNQIFQCLCVRLCRLKPPEVPSLHSACQPHQQLSA